MAHEFEIRKEIEIEATPEQVWKAITDGPEIDSWFMGRSEIEPREGGKARMDMGGFIAESTVTAWEPERRLAYRGDPDPEGLFMAFEYLIEGRAGGTTVLRLIHSGFLGDDWEGEYDALNKGDFMYLQKLAAYLKHFAGRISAFNMLTPGPQVADSDRVWDQFKSALGLTGVIAEGDQVRFAVDELPPAEGVVEFTNLPTYIGVRTTDGLYTFMHGYQDTVVVEHHNFADNADHKQIENAWQGWLTRQFA